MVDRAQFCACDRRTCSLTDVVESAKQGTECACLCLYRVVVGMGRAAYANAHLVRGVEDAIQNSYIALIKALPAVRNPEAILAFIRTIVHRDTCCAIESIARSRLDRDVNAGDRLGLAGQIDWRPASSPEQIFAERERWRIVGEIMADLEPREREILSRFYLEGQTQEQIRSEMHLSSTQFRLTKSRAKQKATAAGRKFLRYPLWVGT